MDEAAQIVMQLIRQIPTNDTLTSHPLVVGAAAGVIAAYDKLIARAVKDDEVSSDGALLGSLLGFLAQALQHPASRVAAAKALQRLCITCHVQLCSVGAVEQLGGMLQEAVQGGLETEGGVMLFEGIARLVAKLSSVEEVTQAFDTLCRPSVTRMQAAVRANGADVDSGARRDALLTELQMLTAALRFMDIRVADTAAHPVMPVLEYLWPELETMAGIVDFQGDTPVMSAFFDLHGKLLSSLGKRMLPQLPTVINVMVDCYQRFSMACALDSLAIAVETFGSLPDVLSAFAEVLAAVSSHTAGLLAPGADGAGGAGAGGTSLQRHPDIIRCFFNMVQRYVMFCPGGLAESMDVLGCIFEMAVACLLVPERTAGRQVASVLSQMIGKQVRLARAFWTTEEVVCWRVSRRCGSGKEKVSSVLHSFSWLRKMY
jgi:hypothetical protein